MVAVLTINFKGMARIRLLFVRRYIWGMGDHHLSLLMLVLQLEAQAQAVGLVWVWVWAWFVLVPVPVPAPVPVPVRLVGWQPLCADI